MIVSRQILLLSEKIFSGCLKILIIAVKIFVLNF